MLLGIRTSQALAAVTMAGVGLLRLWVCKTLVFNVKRFNIWGWRFRKLVVLGVLGLKSCRFWSVGVLGLGFGELGGL